MAAGRTHRYALVDDLNAEWSRLSERSADSVAPLVEHWATRHPALETCQVLPDVLFAIRRDPDAVLAALLTEMTDGQTLAGRVVLQAMLGKVVRLAQAHPDIGVDEFVSALWCRLRTYPLSRRPTSIAANLALDTRKDALRCARLRRLEPTVGSLSEPRWEHLQHCRVDRSLLHQEEAVIEARRVIEAARAIGLIDSATSSVLQTVYLEGANSQSAAIRHDLTPAVVRYRCSQALRRMAQYASILRAAA